jgi:hypothetical protein
MLSIWPDHGMVGHTAKDAKKRNSEMIAIAEEQMRIVG